MLLGLSTALLALWTNAAAGDNIIHTRTTIPSAALSLVAPVGYCLLSWLEHHRSVRLSLILPLYLSSSILFDTARARTLWMLNDYHIGSIPTSILALFHSSIALRAILLILESIEKRGILLPPHKTASSEVIKGPLNRGVFFWVTTLFLRGYTHILKLEDLYPLDPKMHSQDLCEILKAARDRVPGKTAPNTLLSTWRKAFSGPLMSPVIPKLFQIGFTYAQLVLITAAIDLAAQPSGQPYKNNGYGLIGAYSIVYTVIAVAGGQYEWRLHRAAVLMRGRVVPLTYRKALRLDTTSSNVNPSAGPTLVSTDIETITNGIVQLHETGKPNRECASNLPHMEAAWSGLCHALCFCHRHYD